MYAFIWYVAIIYRGLQIKAPLYGLYIYFEFAIRCEYTTYLVLTAKRLEYILNVLGTRFEYYRAVERGLNIGTVFANISNNFIIFNRIFMYMCKHL